jgi:hypothetical protein
MGKKLISVRKPKLRITPSGVRVTKPSARIGGKVGLNVSSRGVSASARTKMGTISTGKVPVKSSKKRKTKSCLGTSCLMLLMIILVGLAHRKGSTWARYDLEEE